MASNGKYLSCLIYLVFCTFLSVQAAPAGFVQRAESSSAPASATPTPSSKPSASASGTKSSSAGFAFSSTVSAPQSSASGKTETGEETPIGDLVSAGLTEYLKQSKAIDGTVFFGLKEWRGLSIDDETSSEETNRIIFDACDRLPSREEGKEGQQQSFSQLFVNYIQNVTTTMQAATDKQPKDQDKLKKAEDKQTEDCKEAFSGGLLDDAIQDYQLQVILHKLLFFKKKNETAIPPFTDWHDKAFIDWTQGNDKYAEPIKKCYDADIAWRGVYNDTYGDNFDLFSASYEAIGPLLDVSPAFTEGINMKILETDDDSDMPGEFGGALRPEYTIPLLKGTLKSWVDPKINETSSNSTSDNAETADKADAAKPAFEWSSNSSAPSSSAPSSSRRDLESHPYYARHHPRAFSPRFVIPKNTSQSDVDAIQKKYKAAKEVKDFRWRGDAKPKVGTTISPVKEGSALAFHMSVKQITRMDIDQGKWFDQGKTAEAIRDAQDDDEPSKAAKPTFDEYFGTKEHPGNLAFWPVQAVVVQNPSWEYTLASVDAAKGMEGEDGVQVEGQKVKYKDTSDRAYIVGFIMQPFWPLDKEGQ